LPICPENVLDEELRQEKRRKLGTLRLLFVSTSRIANPEG
jgi:hypothetical protein